MTSAAKPSFGNQFWICPAGGTLAQVTELLNIKPPAVTRDTQDATTHDSTGGASEKISEGIYEVGPFEIQIHYIPGSAFDTAMLTAIATGAKQDFKAISKGASGNRQVTGSGFVTEYAVEDFAIKGKQVATLKGDVTGPLTSAVAS